MQERDQNPRLGAALRALAEEEAASGASAAVRARLFAEVRSRRGSGRRAGLKTLAAVVTVAVVAASIAVWRVSWPTSSPVSTADSGETEVATAFFPLFYASVPMTDAQIVRVEVSPSVPASFGIAPADVSEGGSRVILADVLVGEDGLARAVRFVRPE